MKSFSVIGAGRVGTALALALTRKGFSLKIISDRSLGRARRARKLIGQGRASANNLLAVSSAETIFICVPDDLIPDVVRQISDADYRGKFVFHTSGACSSKLLEPLAKKGAAVASFHPIQTFTRQLPGPEIFKGIFFGIEGQLPAMTLAIKLSRRLGARALLMTPEEKPLYHLACSMASNFLIVLLFEVKELLTKLGLEEETAIRILFPLLNETLHNVKKIGVEKSLTGPVVRGDLETVRKHLALISDNPELDNLYRTMASQALKIARKKGLPEGKIKALKHLLEHK